MYVNETRDDICECGCEWQYHEEVIPGDETAHCPNCVTECAAIDIEG